MFHFQPIATNNITTLQHYNSTTLQHYNISILQQHKNRCAQSKSAIQSYAADCARSQGNNNSGINGSSSTARHPWMAQ